MSRLKNKICIVTGAASGIGRTTALHFAGEGAEVAAVDIDRGALEDLAGSAQGISPHCVDVVNAEVVGEFVSGLPRIDVLFNCAGRVAVGTALECSQADFQQTMDLNVTAIFHLMRAVLPDMVAQGSGSIINMASVISSIGAAPERFAYGASKAAVIGMTKSVARDFADKGVRCNAICPSAVETPSMSARIEAMADPDAARAMFSSRQPVGRMGTPEEIAELALYLASNASRFVTGSAIVIDGGAKL